jgi:hypothetical protein
VCSSDLERAPEAGYIASVGAGAALTIVSGGIAVLMWRRRRDERPLSFRPHANEL